MIGDAIRGKLEASLTCWHLDVLNESYMHSVPANSETHFRVVVVSDAFDEVRRVQRHRLVNRLLADELAGPVHALAIEAVTPAEWEKNGGPALTAPKCMGGSKADRS
jgi:stress-induced morphogen